MNNSNQEETSGLIEEVTRGFKTGDDVRLVNNVQTMHRDILKSFQSRESELKEAIREMTVRVKTAEKEAKRPSGAPEFNEVVTRTQQEQRRTTGNIANH